MNALIELAWPIVALVGIGVGVWCFHLWVGDSKALEALSARIETLAGRTQERIATQEGLLKLQSDVTINTQIRLDKMEKQLAILPPVGPRHSESTLKGFR